jgi:tetratricopeptide (TPR) repeat protein
MKASMLANREEYAEAESALDKAIVQKPRIPILYINRALARFQLNNIRGAMSDYDQAIEIDASNYVAHYNRGLLRAQVGDDNRAIDDFNFVLSIEPDNMIALYNRAILLDQTGDFRGAIRDISTVIEEYPQFWAGYTQRAAILRKIGDTYGAERDEFKVLKAQMEARTGKYKVQKTTRRKSERKIEDYNKLVVDDEQTDMNGYSNEFRGRVQNRQTDLKCMSSYVLSFYAKEHPTRRYVPYSQSVEQFSRDNALDQPLLLCNDQITLDSTRIALHQERVLTDVVLGRTCQLVMDNYIVRDYETAMSVLDSVIVSVPDVNPLYHFLRAQVRTSQVEAQPINDNELRLRYLEILQDWKYCARALPDFPFASYNMANTYVKLKDYPSAIEAYTEAIRREPDMPEAYFNRGVAHILQGNVESGLADLSRAGEMGLYQAYSLIKKYSAKGRER